MMMMMMKKGGSSLFCNRYDKNNFEANRVPQKEL